MCGLSLDKDAQRGKEGGGGAVEVLQAVCPASANRLRGYTQGGGPSANRGRV